jgi:transcriptional regulator with XRE-family HTH domain
VFAQFSENNFLMYLYEDGVVRYAPLCIHSFRLSAPCKLLEAQRFNQQYHSYEEIESVPDRLRWCRLRMGLMQKDVAQRVGISRVRYTDMETGAIDHYDKETVDKLAALFGVPPTDFLDDYNRFLYEGQGQKIQALRQRLGLKKKPFARLLNIEPRLLQAWETGEKRMTKTSWERYFKGKIQ